MSRQKEHTNNGEERQESSVLSNNTRPVYLLHAPLCCIWLRLSYDYLFSFSSPSVEISSFFYDFNVISRLRPFRLSMNSDQASDYSSIDTFQVSRRRKPNFTDHEVLNIIDQYDVYKELLHSREASKTVIAQKQAIWKQITENLNAAYPQVERTVEDVRRKWKKLQSEAKREVAAYRAAQQSGGVTPVSNRQMTFYHRILSICRAPNPSSTLLSLPPVSLATNGNHEASERVVDSPVASDSPDDDRSASPPSTTPTPSGNGQISKRTLEKQRKQIKPARLHSTVISAKPVPNGHSARYELLAKRKRTLELNCQKLLCDKECLLLERKNLELRLAMNECEHERIQLEKRRLDVTLQKYALTPLSNGNNHFHPSSEFDEHEDNASVDEMSDINE